MKHVLIESASQKELDAVKEAADWFVDGVATATQDRRFLRGDKECDELLVDVMERNCIIACLRAIQRLKENSNKEI